MWADMRTGVRFLARQWGFAAAALITLALGIGANTAIFSVVYGVMLKPLAFPEPERLIDLGTLSIPAAEDILARNVTLESVGYSVRSGLTLTGTGEPSSLTGMEVSGGFFHTYLVPPALGRTLRADDTEPGRERVVVLGHQLWQRRFGADPHVLGRQITLAIQSTGIIAPFVRAGQTYTVVGVMPPPARFPVDADLWIPLARGAYTPRMGMSPRAFHNVSVIARLHPGASLARANDDLHRIASSLAADHPDTDTNRPLIAISLRDAVAGHYRTALWLLLGAAAGVLLLACVNVGSLILARNQARRQEVATRTFLGASRARLIRQFLVESLLLALIGGALSLIIAIWSTGVVRALAPPDLPRLDEIGVDVVVFAYALGTSLLAGVILGIAPAIRLTAAAPRAKARTHARGLLIAAQIALAFPLVVGSVLALRSLDTLLHVDLGYQREHVLAAYVKPSATACATFDACVLTIDAILTRTRQQPQVHAVAIAGTRPLSTPLSVAVTTAGDSRSLSELQMVTPQYFAVLGMPILAGRAFDPHDTARAPHVAIVNTTLARERFAGHAVGKRLRLLRDEWLDIVGEVPDTRDVTPSKAPMPAVYVPLAQANLIPRLSLLVRGTSDAGDPLSIAPLIQREVWEADRDAGISEMRTLDHIFSESVAEPRFQTLLLTAFAVIAVLVALAGVHGLIAYATGGRLREFGVRLALGARPRDIIRLVLIESLPAVTLGIVAGAGAAWILTRFLRALLFEIAPTDPPTYAIVAILTMLVAAAAYYVPARRAARVDPMVVLRND